MDSSQTCDRCGQSVVELTDGLCPGCRKAIQATVSLKPSTTGNRTISPTRPSADSGVDIAKEFGEYDLIEEIARGGMGVVYKARHRRLNRITALKMILSGRFSSPEELQRFYVEAEAAARLDHPGIVPVFEIGECNEQAFFAMKFIEGGSLADQIQHFQNEPRQAIELLVAGHEFIA